MEDNFGVAKISNIYLRCLKFLIFLGGVNGRWWDEPTYKEKMRVPGIFPSVQTYSS